MASWAQTRAGADAGTGLGAPLTRRGALRLLAAGSSCAAGLTLARPRPAAAGPGAGGAPAETSETSAEFNGPYTAWQGYASTAGHGIVPGAVPVKAPASADIAWSAPIPGMTGGIALRQAGQATWIYACLAGELARIDAATGALEGTVALPAAPLPSTPPVFSESTVCVVLEDGRVAAFDEELIEVWTSEPMAPPAPGSRLLASAPVSAGGAVHVALAVEDSQGAVAEIRLLALAAIDGTVLWSTALEPSAGACGAPVLIGFADALAVSDGGDTVFVRALAGGAVASELALTGPVRGRIARLARGVERPGGVAPALVLGVDGGRAVVAAYSDGELASCGEAAAGEGDELAPLAPVAASGSAWFALEGSQAYREFCIDAAGSPVARARVAAPAPDAARIAARPLAVAFGDNAREASVQVVAPALDGTLAVLAADSPDPGLWTVSLDAAAKAAALASPLVNRDGALIVPVALSCDPGDTGLVALAPDEGRAAATPVGGGEGLDTLGASLAGFTLPNGAGIGVGAVFLAATFAAYALIRNRGGRGRSDEGVDEWRAEHGRGGGDADDPDRAGGRC